LFCLFILLLLLLLLIIIIVIIIIDCYLCASMNHTQGKASLPTLLTGHQTQ
jgi:hypothetical protein